MTVLTPKDVLVILEHICFSSPVRSVPSTKCQMKMKIIRVFSRFTTILFFFFFINSCLCNICDTCLCYKTGNVPLHLKNLIKKLKSVLNIKF